MQGIEDRKAVDALDEKLGNVDCKCSNGTEPCYKEYVARRKSCGVTFLGTACESWPFGMVRTSVGRC